MTNATTTSATRILIIVHQAHSTPGRVGELLEERGCVLDRRCPSLGDPLPCEARRVSPPLAL